MHRRQSQTLLCHQNLSLFSIFFRTQSPNPVIFRSLFLVFSDSKGYVFCFPLFSLMLNEADGVCPNSVRVSDLHLSDGLESSRGYQALFHNVDRSYSTHCPATTTARSPGGWCCWCSWCWPGWLSFGRPPDNDSSKQYSWMYVRRYQR